jgi:uncharacterized protein YlxP (DUF503 family)
MVIGCCQMELHLPACTSLKDKRRVLASLRDRLRNRHNVSFAEVEHQDLWQRAGLALAAVSSHQEQLEKMFSTIRTEIEGAIPGYVIACDIEYL